MTSNLSRLESRADQGVNIVTSGSKPGCAGDGSAFSPVLEFAQDMEWTSPDYGEGSSVAEGGRIDDGAQLLDLDHVIPWS